MIDDDDIVKTTKDYLDELVRQRSALIEQVKVINEKMLSLFPFKKGDFVKFPIKPDKMEMGTVDYATTDSIDGDLYIRIDSRMFTHWMSCSDKTRFNYDEFDQVTLLDKDVVKNDRKVCENLINEIRSLDQEEDLTIRQIREKREDLNNLLGDAQQHCLHEMVDTGEPARRDSDDTVWRCKFCEKYGGV